MRATSESAEWIFLATNLGLEILSAACDQASSPRRPHYALCGMLLAIAAVLISIWELIYRGKKERVVLRRWGILWRFYHSPPRRHTPFGTLPDIYGLVAGISQCICSMVQYVYCIRHADSPFKASLLPAIFLMCLGGSRLSNNRMNANTTDNKDSGENSSSTIETSLHPIPKYYAPANIPFLDDQEVEGRIKQWEQQQERQRQRHWRRLQQWQEQERQRQPQRLQQWQEQQRLQQWLQEQEHEQEQLLQSLQGHQLQQWLQDQEREREQLLQERQQQKELRERQQQKGLQERQQQKELQERQQQKELWERHLQKELRKRQQKELRERPLQEMKLLLLQERYRR